MACIWRWVCVCVRACDCTSSSFHCVVRSLGLLSLSLGFFVPLALGVLRKRIENREGQLRKEYNIPHSVALSLFLSRSLARLAFFCILLCTTYSTVAFSIWFSTVLAMYNFKNTSQNLHKHIAILFGLVFFTSFFLSFLRFTPFDSARWNILSLSFCDWLKNVRFSQK